MTIDRSTSGASRCSCESNGGSSSSCASGLNTTFVRVGYFAENWANVVPVAKQEGVLPVFFPVDLPIPTVAVRDIGPVAARALLDGPRGERIIELAGPREVSANDVARVLSELLGREVKTTRAPLDAFVPTFTRAGLSEDFAKLFRELYTCIGSGEFKWEGKHESVRGPTQITEALRGLI